MRSNGLVVELADEWEDLGGEGGDVLHIGHHLVGEVGLHAANPGHAQTGIGETVEQAITLDETVVKSVDEAGVLDKAVVKSVDEAGVLDKASVKSVDEACALDETVVETVDKSISLDESIAVKESVAVHKTVALDQSVAKTIDKAVALDQTVAKAVADEHGHGAGAAEGSHQSGGGGELHGWIGMVLEK